jgi:ribosome maturation factor RimP
MTVEAQIAFITELVQGLLKEDYFLVEIRIKPNNDIKLFLDADGGVNIAECIACNRKLYKELEESGIYPAGDFALEVSSPGLGEPLKLYRQYVKNLQRQVEVVLKDGQVIEGKMIAVNETGIGVEETKGKNKKKEVINHDLLFDNIKTTKIQVVF